MYYRRKVLLALLESFGGKLEKIRLQKLLLLYCKFQEQPVYHFVPYKFGCFSFQANADLKTLEKYGQVLEDDIVWVKKDQTIYKNLLREKDRKILFSIKHLYEGKTNTELIKHTYLKYPWFAHRK
ncbi:hypothetical protein RCC89_13260 [Cytophagaceae bacterium ABcell3]|nr:hypothetical protein RCC89_13260 [Cytophagaceae bacterium ABcell3]